MVGAIALERKPALRCLNTSRGSTIVIVVTPPSATSRRFASCKSGGRACSKRRHRRYLLEAEKRGEPHSAAACSFPSHLKRRSTFCALCGILRLLRFPFGLRYPVTRGYNRLFPGRWPMGFLADKRVMITGMLSNRSIAFGIAKAMKREGASLAFTYQGEGVKDRVLALASELGSDLVFPCDVTSDEQIAQLYAAI